MIDKHFPTRYNKCRWNVCFIFSLREIKYDEHKVKSCYLLPLIRRTQKQLDVIERKIQTGDNRRQLIEQYTNLEHLDRETVETLIDYILVGKRIPGTRNVPIEIHWNF